MRSSSDVRIRLAKTIAVARMALLLSGIPHTVSAATGNCLCGSGMEAVSLAARAIAADEISLAIAGGVESMSRAPMVIPKASSAFSRSAEIYDSTLGWRFVNPELAKRYGTASMPETAKMSPQLTGSTAPRKTNSLFVPNKGRRSPEGWNLR